MDSGDSWTTMQKWHTSKWILNISTALQGRVHANTNWTSCFVFIFKRKSMNLGVGREVGGRSWDKLPWYFCFDCAPSGLALTRACLAGIWRFIGSTLLRSLSLEMERSKEGSHKNLSSPWLVSKFQGTAFLLLGSLIFWCRSYSVVTWENSTI